MRQFNALIGKGVSRVASGELGRQMGFTASQIRQDFNCFGGFGQQGYGYNVHQLRDGIAEVLGMNTITKAVLVGAGNMGRALIKNFHFEECGCTLLAAFDVAPELIGRNIAGTPILSSEEMESFISEHDVDVAILTLSRSMAEAVARRVSAAGVRGIWNITGTDITVPEGNTIIEEVHLSDSLLTLCYYLKDADKENGS